MENGMKKMIERDEPKKPKLYDYEDHDITEGTVVRHQQAHAETHRLIEGAEKSELAISDRIGWTKTPQKLLCLFELLYEAGYIDDNTDKRVPDLLSRYFRHGKEEYNKNTLSARKSEMGGERKRFIFDMLNDFDTYNVVKF